MSRETKGSLSRNRKVGNGAILIYVDADYGNSKETSKSVTELVIRFNGAAIDWRRCNR